MINLGVLIAVFEDNTAENLLKSLIQSNPNAAQLKTQFQFPSGEKVEYDVNAPQNKWVVKAIIGQAVDRDFDK